jgi:hypothetical protein
MFILLLFTVNGTDMNTHISIYVSANDYIDSNIGTIFRYVPVNYRTQLHNSVHTRMYMCSAP